MESDEKIANIVSYVCENAKQIVEDGNFLSVFARGIKESEFVYSTATTKEDLQKKALEQTCADFQRNGDIIIGDNKLAQSEMIDEFKEKDTDQKLRYIREKFNALGVSNDFRDKIIANFNQGGKAHALEAFVKYVPEMYFLSQFNSTLGQNANRELFQFTPVDGDKK